MPNRNGPDYVTEAFVKAWIGKLLSNSVGPNNVAKHKLEKWTKSFAPLSIQIQARTSACITCQDTKKQKQPDILGTSQSKQKLGANMDSDDSNSLPDLLLVVVLFLCRKNE